MRCALKLNRLLTVRYSDVKVSRPPLQLLSQTLLLGKGQQGREIVVSFEFIMPVNKLESEIWHLILISAVYGGSQI